MPTKLGVKELQLLSLLHAQPGNYTEIKDLTGWTGDSIRRTIARLRKKGYDIVCKRGHGWLEGTFSYHGELPKETSIADVQSVEHAQENAERAEPQLDIEQRHEVLPASEEPAGTDSTNAEDL